MSHHQMKHCQMSHHQLRILKTSRVKTSFAMTYWFELSFLLELKKPLPSQKLKRHNPSWLVTATAVLVADSCVELAFLLVELSLPSQPLNTPYPSWLDFQENLKNWTILKILKNWTVLTNLYSLKHVPVAVSLLHRVSTVL